MQISVTKFFIFTSFREEEKSFIIRAVLHLPKNPKVCENAEVICIGLILILCVYAASIFHENFNKKNIVVPRHLEE